MATVTVTTLDRARAPAGAARGPSFGALRCAILAGMTRGATRQGARRMADVSSDVWARLERAAGWDAADEAWAEAERARWIGGGADAESLRTERALQLAVGGAGPERIVRRAEVWSGWTLTRGGDGLVRVREAGAGRKRSGSFYTPPALALATARRTLAPLVERADGLPVAPEAILRLSVCDPACGSGAFLVAALEVLTQALERSVAHHGWGGLDAGAPTARAGAPPGDGDRRGAPAPGGEPLASEPSARRRQLARFATRALCGVDRDRGALAAARVALAAAVAGPGAPLAAADVDAVAARLVCGDALVGTFPADTGYPRRAFARPGGDEDHPAGLAHSAGAFAAVLAGRLAALKARGGSLRLALDGVEERELWCALWFWPPERLALAPGPDDFHGASDEARRTARAVCAELRALHWDLAFPDVSARGGFDALLGNPPWETVKNVAREFFGAVDPGYLELGARDAARRRAELFARDARLEAEWLRLRARDVAYAHWCRAVGRSLHAAEHDRPFQHRGTGDLNGYKLFLELGVRLLRDGGRLGMVVPGALYCDKGTRALRRLLLDRCRWEWLYAFDNRDAIFPIHKSFKFCAVVAERGGRTEAVRAAFMQRSLDDWSGDGAAARPYPRAVIERTSPQAAAFLELGEPRDLELLERLARVAEPVVSAAGWDVAFSSEYHMSADSRSFRTLEEVAARGARQGPDGVWAAGDERWLPVLQGAMIAQHDANAARHAEGSGQRARFEPHPRAPALPRPQHLVDAREAAARGFATRLRVAYRRIAPATNARTVIAAVVGGWATGDSLFQFAPRSDDPRRVLCLAAIFNAFVFDWQVRLRLGGVNLSRFVMEDVLLPPWPVVEPRADELAEAAARLGLVGPVGVSARALAPEWVARAERAPAVAPDARRQLRARLDRRVAELYGLTPDDLAWILRDCGHPTDALTHRRFFRGLPPKGFWRVDRGLEPAERLPVALLAAHDGPARG